MNRRQRAIVIGGSMSGLVAARVLTGHFAEVVLVDRDRWPEGPEPRKGVPQGRHAHALLSSGRGVLEDLFPQLGEELLQLGALRGRYNQVRWFDNGVYHARFEGLEALLVSRPRLESSVRERVGRLANVHVRPECGVAEIVFDGSRVTGVRLEPDGAGGHDVMRADLVVDATGRGSQSPAWLQRAGFEPPQTSDVRVGLGYATRIYRRRPDHLGGDLAVVCPSAPPQRRGGVALAMEGDRWMVTLFGMLGEHPPTDAEGFAAFATTLPAPDIHDLVSTAEPLTDFVPFKFPQSTRRHYERLSRFPDGYLVFGDAICSFNPIYGQGMSSAALQAAALHQCLLRADDGSLAARFFKAASAVVDAPWTMAVGGDLRYPEVEGPRGRMVAFVNWYLGKLHIAAAGDPKVALAFHRVANLLDPPPSLLQPATALRVLRGNLVRRRAPH